MATPWDRAAARYVEEWVPRFMPYHLDLVREMALAGGQRVLVTSCGPGSEVLAVARAVGEHGVVRATDKAETMVAMCATSVTRAGFANVTWASADATDVSGGPWDGILCAFGLWQLDDRPNVVRTWGSALARAGKLGVLTWGPPDADDPFERLSACLSKQEPSYALARPQIEAERERMAALFEQGGLTMVRHTLVRHVMSFASAESFVCAMREAGSWRRIWEELGPARMDRVAVAFYDEVGGPDTPLTFAPPATLAIAARPGAEVALATRPSVRVPDIARS